MSRLEDAAEREAFKKWATARGVNLLADEHRPGHFYYVNTEDLWSAWQARAALSPDGRQA